MTFLFFNHALYCQFKICKGLCENLPQIRACFNDQKFYFRLITARQDMRTWHEMWQFLVTEDWEEKTVGFILSPNWNKLSNLLFFADFNHMKLVLLQNWNLVFCNLRIWFFWNFVVDFWQLVIHSKFQLLVNKSKFCIF